MRIHELRLEAFGKFTDRTLDLSGGHEGLHIVVGFNEAGKSTALAAVEQLLFGIPHRSIHAFVHPMQKLRIGGTIAHSSGRSLSFVRRKGQRETLRSADDTESIGDDSLMPYLGSVDAATFTSMFGLNWEKLQDEGQEIQKGSGEIGPLLFAAGSGVGSLRRVRDRLRADAERLFLPRGKKSINEALREIDDLRKRINELAKESLTRERIDSEIDQSESLRSRLIEQLRTAQRTARRLQAIRQALPLVTERKKLDQDGESLTGVMRLADDFRDRYRQIASDRIHLDRQVSSLSQSKSEWLKKRESIVVDEKILHGAEEIESLRHDWGAIEKAARDKIALEAEANQLADRSRQILRETMGEEVPTWSGRDLQIVEELCQRWADLQQRREYLEEKRQGIESRRDRATQEKEGIGHAIDIRGLADGLREAEELGNVDSTLEDLERKSASTREQIDRWRASIGLTGMDLETLARFPWPSEELVNHFDVELKEVKQRRLEMTAKLDEMVSELDQRNREIRDATQGRALPKFEDLHEAREIREELWRKIRQSIDAEQWPSRMNLDQFELAYRQSDLLADRLRETADQVARLARWDAERSSLEAQIRKAKEKLAGWEGDQRVLEAGWGDLWNMAGVKIHPPRAMLAMVRTIRQIITATLELEEIASQCRQLAEKREIILQSLSSAFRTVGSPTRFMDAIRLARELVDENARRSSKEEQIGRVLEEIAREWRGFESEKLRWEEALANWQGEWDSTRKRLTMGDVSTSMALDWVKRERERLGIESDRAKLVARMEAIDADAVRFSERLKIWESAGPVKVIDLASRLSLARQEKVRLEEIEKQIRLGESEEVLCREELSRASAQWQALLREAGTEDETLLPMLMDRSDRLREWEKDRSRVDMQLAPWAQELRGESLDELANRWNSDDLAHEEELAGRAVEQTQQELSLLDQSLGQWREKQSRIDGQGEGACLAERLQSKLATLDQDVQRYLRLTLAGRVLDQTIEQYRKENQGPLLQRASEIFGVLTCGSFERLDVEFDERSQPYLVGIRPGSREPIDVSAMSEGTADQLYLSVRLAAVEQYVTNHEPIPFLVDDILINFDDDRAAAALRVLGDLSQRTQVIFFTHHAHLVEIARREISEDFLYVHELEPSMASDDPPPVGLSPRTKRSKR